MKSKWLDWTPEAGFVGLKALSRRSLQFLKSLTKTEPQLLAFGRK